MSLRSGGHWSADWRSTDSSKVTWLIERLRLAGAAPPAPPPSDVSASAAGAGGGSTREDIDDDDGGGGGSRSDGAGGIGDVDIMDDDGGGVGGAGGGRSAYELAVDRMFNMNGNGSGHAAAPSSEPIRTRAAPKPPAGWSASRKAVVYSAFWEHIQLIQMHLNRRGVPFALMLRHEKAQSKAAELERFRFDPGCGVLLMDTSGVVGLDLSFASLVIAMEPVPDASVLAQLEARAHRMGQRRPVEVEVLAMKGCTAEEAMLATVDPVLAAELAAAAATAGSTAVGMEENVDAERARHKQCLALVRAVSGDSTA